MEISDRAFYYRSRAGSDHGKQSPPVVDDVKGRRLPGRGSAGVGHFARFGGGIPGCQVHRALFRQKVPAENRRGQQALSNGRAMKDRSAGAYNIEDLREIARRRVPKGMFEFVDRGAEDEVALRNNRTAFERIRLQPRALVAVSRRSQEITLFGKL